MAVEAWYESPDESHLKLQQHISIVNCFRYMFQISKRDSTLNIYTVYGKSINVFDYLFLVRQLRTLVHT